MMMWGKWRIYDRTEYESGTAKSPPRSSYGKIKHKNTDKIKIQVKRDEVTDVRKDSRTRLPLLLWIKFWFSLMVPYCNFH